MRTRFVLPLLLVACGPESPTPMSPSEAKSVEVASVPDAGSTALEEPASHRDGEPAPTALERATSPEKEDAGAPMTNGDPLAGKFSLADATEGLAGSGPLVATITTSLGALKCKLYDDKAPETVANFVGLARGLRPWKEPGTGNWVKRPVYDGTTFHRVIRGFMIQGGDPKGNGTGEPGYVIKDEIWKGAKHDRAGLLCMANRGPNTNGAQFFITDASAPHLDKSYTIFGECSPVSVVHAIAKVPTGPMDRPLNDVTISSVTIAREANAKP